MRVKMGMCEGGEHEGEDERSDESNDDESEGEDSDEDEKVSMILTGVCVLCSALFLRGWGGF